MNWLTSIAARLLSRKAHASRREIRNTTNAMRKHLGLSGRI